MCKGFDVIMIYTFITKYAIGLLIILRWLITEMACVMCLLTKEITVLNQLKARLNSDYYTTYQYFMFKIIQSAFNDNFNAIAH